MKLNVKLIISSVLLLPSILTCLDILVMWTFGTYFLAGFEIRNSTDETIRITPYSEGYGESNYVQLPLYFSRYPFLISSWRIADFEMEPKDSKWFLYDDDDAYLEGIIIERQDGEYLDMPAVYEDGRNYIEIENISELNGATPELITLTQEGIFWRIVWINIVLLIGLLNIPYFVYLVRKKRKQRRSKAD
ncbi:hypothetical protein O3Q51_05545 [Cryomorphaceae bacterium 1068]|nr:hypothetical protein [Cryomorphaceae bacterium 1068]